MNYLLPSFSHTFNPQIIPSDFTFIITFGLKIRQSYQKWSNLQRNYNVQASIGPCFTTYFLVNSRFSREKTWASTGQYYRILGLSLILEGRESLSTESSILKTIFTYQNQVSNPFSSQDVYIKFCVFVFLALATEYRSKLLFPDGPPSLS